MKKLRNFMLLGAGYTTPNLGVWTLVTGAVTSVLHAYPDARIYLLDYNLTSENYQVRYPGGTGRVQLVNLRFSKKFWLPTTLHGYR